MVKSRQVSRDPNVELAIFVVAALILYFIAITIPVSDTKDVYIDLKVQKPLTGAPKLVQVSTRVQSSTLLEVPEFMGTIWGLQAGDVSVVAKTSTVTVKKTLGDVTMGFDTPLHLTLKNVPSKETILEIQLYESTELKETKVISI
jgi:hypothetical protein